MAEPEPVSDEPTPADATDIAPLDPPPATPAPEPVLVAADSRWLRRALVMVIIAILALQVVNFAWDRLGGFLFNLLLAWLIAISFDPLVSYLAHRGLRRGLATAIVAVSTLALLGVFIALFGGPGWYAMAFWGFVIAAVTDFLDGWLARRFDATSTLGAILDPIADKVLVAGMVVGIAALGNWIVALAGGLILFREFSVSALRETLAPRGLKLPVTTLAKWKTTLQLVALAAELFVFGWRAWGLPEDPELIGRAFMTAHGVLALAAVVTVWTGVEYALAARKALKA